MMNLLEEDLHEGELTEEELKEVERRDKERTKAAAVPVTYTVRGRPCSAFSFVKTNKTSGTYEVRLRDDFAFRVYVPRDVAEQLTQGEGYPAEIALIAVLPEYLDVPF